MARNRGNAIPDPLSPKSFSFGGWDTGSSRWPVVGQLTHYPLADDNFYPVTLQDIELARRQNNLERVQELEALRADRFVLMEALSQLPSDMIFFTASAR